MTSVFDMQNVKAEINLGSLKTKGLFTREVVKNGSGAKINFLKEYIGKKVYILIPDEDSQKKRKKTKKWQVNL